MPSLISANETFIEQSIKSERESDFDSNSAYGEILDNSIQAEAKNIKISFSTVVKRRNKEILDYVAFGDDGLGMSPEIIENCLTSGFSSRYNNRDGIGRFGVGMTKAFLNQCLICEVYSKEKGEDWHYTVADISENNKKKNEIPKAIKKNPPKELEKLSGKDSGTLVVWKEHDKQDGKPSDLIENFREWCGRTYRKFIFKGVKFYIDNNIVKSIDPTFLNTKTSYFPNDEEGTILHKGKISWLVDAEKRKDPDHKEDIEITVTLAPTHLREGRGSGAQNPNAEKFQKIQKERKMDEDWNGISILRNDREVFFGYPHPWTGGINLNEAKGRWVGIEIRFNAVHDKSFVVKNIKTGAKPIVELKRSITDNIKGVFRSACEQVTDQWNKYESDLIIEKEKTGTITGHEEAERIAKGQTSTKDKLTENKDAKELNKNALALLDEKGKHVEAAWLSKFEAQPYTILNSEWKGADFVQIAYTKDGAVMKYNLSHPYHKEIIAICSDMEKENNPEKLKKNAKKLRTMNDLLLMTYCRAEKQKNPELEVSNTEDFLEDLRMDWGVYLKRHLRDVKD